MLLGPWTVATPAIADAGPTAHLPENAASPGRVHLDPRGRVHLPIGLPNTLDTLKTFVEPEGCFSPGFGTYGVYVWLYDRAGKRLIAGTQPDVPMRYGLGEGGKIVPWMEFEHDGLRVHVELCQVRRPCPGGYTHIVAAQINVHNTGSGPRAVRVYAAVRPPGPAGGNVHQIALNETGNALLVDGHPALVTRTPPSGGGVLDADTIADWALRGDVPLGRTARSPSGDASGVLVFDATLGNADSRTVELICPVLAGRRAARHRWDGVSAWAQRDLATLNPVQGGTLQPDPGVDFYRRLDVQELFAQARGYWEDFAGRVKLRLPDPRWAEAFAAILGHVALAMNEGAPDVAVVNYNVFNRDGVYVTNILQKAGHTELARRAIDYFLEHPFSGRSYPEADNPGQVLWIMGRHWFFDRDRAWLQRVYPSVVKLAEMIRYYRTTPGPHWVQMDGLAFGDQVTPDNRRELQPGRCDGHHPEYTEAFDIAGMRAAALLAGAAGRTEASETYRRLARELFDRYDARFGADLTAGYGSYCVLWPCRLYRFDRGRAWAAFRNTGPQSPEGWHYFPLARAHQGLLAGQANAAWGTLERFLDHELMRGWYLLDEGGKSGLGGWERARTTWNPNVAMPHGWAVAEFWLLMRDALVFEDSGRIVLFAGVNPAWLTDGPGMEIRNLPTQYGLLDVQYRPTTAGAVLRFGDRARPPRGFVLVLPPGRSARATAAAGFASASQGDRLDLPWIAGRVEIVFENR